MEWDQIVTIAKTVSALCSPGVTVLFVFTLFKYVSLQKELLDMRDQRDKIQKDFDDHKAAEAAIIRMEARLDQAREERRTSRMGRQLREVLEKGEKWEQKGEPLTPQPSKQSQSKKKGELE